MALFPKNATRIEAVALLVCIVAAAYWTTLLTHVAGSNDPLLEDGGEIQVTLNVWGTLHGTGYPLFTMLGNGFVHITRALGVGPATAPSLYALAWGILALALFYALVRTLTGQFGLALGATALLGLSRAVWAYNVFPKTYSMSLAFFVAILAIALWPGIPAQRRVWLLALVGGFGVAHHRLIAFVLAGALVAVLPALWSEARRNWRSVVTTIVIAFPLALIGFIPYIYLPLRALAHGAWVYGNPSTWAGFWHEFTAEESNYLFALAPTFATWLSDVRETLRIFIDQLTPLGVALTIPLAIYAVRRRHEARIALLYALPLVAFVLIWPHAVVAQAVVEPIVMFLVFMAVLLVADLVTQGAKYFPDSLTPSPTAERGRYSLTPLSGSGEGQGVRFLSRRAIFPIATTICMLGLIAWNWPYLSTISRASEGDREIALAHTVPRDSGLAVFMLPWGMRYSAVAFSHYVTGENTDLAIADHKADFSELLDSGHSLYTDRDTFYTLPLSWWDSRIGRVYLSSSVDGVVSIRSTPIHATKSPPAPIPVADGIVYYDTKLECVVTGSEVKLHVTWGAQTAPARDFSVFVHLIGRDSSDVLATGDESAPIYGWYPTSRWSADELVPDTYTFQVPILNHATAVQFGMYEQPTPGKFVDYGVTTLPIPDALKCLSN